MNVAQIEGAVWEFRPGFQPPGSFFGIDTQGVALGWDKARFQRYENEVSDLQRNRSP
jgi:hypothetical protein